MNYTFFKLRGGGTINITGLSNSVSYTETNSYSRGGRTLTFSVPTPGTASGASYTDVGPAIFTFAGTPSNTSNVKVSFTRGGVPYQYNSTTASGSNLFTFVNAINSDLSAAGLSTATYGSGLTASITIAPPVNSGSWFNGVGITVNVTKGTGNSLTYSLTPTLLPNSLGTPNYSTSFSGGSTTYQLTLDFPKLGDNANVVPLTVTGSY